MALEVSITPERLKETIKLSLGMLLVWTIWLSLMSRMQISWTYTCSAFVVLLAMGTFFWTLIDAMIWLLLASWIFAVFSVTPPGLFWFCGLITFVAIKMITVSFEVRARRHWMLIVGGFSIFHSLLMALIISQLADVRVFSLWLVQATLASAFFDAVVGGLLFTKLRHLMVQR